MPIYNHEYIIYAPLWQVKLFNYPVVVQHAPSLVYRGHSSFVPNVRYASNLQETVVGHID
jgi:hypothetical protein